VQKQTTVLSCLFIPQNATRFVQRIGRTARQRNGKVIVLATEGRELQMIKELIATKDTINKSISRSKDIAKYFYTAPRLIPKQYNPQCIETKFTIATQNEVEEEAAEKKKKTKKGKGKVVASSSRESITDHFAPASKRKTRRAVAPEPEIPEIEEVEDDDDDDAVVMMETDVVVIEPIIENEKFDGEEYSEVYMIRIEQFIKDNELEDNNFLRDLIEYRAKDGVNSIKRLAKILESPPKKDLHVEINFNDLADTLSLSPVAKKPVVVQRKDKKKDSGHEGFSRYGNQFDVQTASSPFVPVKSKANESIEQKQQIIENMQFATPDFSQFQRQQRKLSASTPLCGRNLMSEMNAIFLSQLTDAPQTSKMVEHSTSAEEKSAAVESPPEKFPFLGINSISDIFEGCETNIFSDISPHKSDTATAASQREGQKSESEESDKDNHHHEQSIEQLEIELLGCSIDLSQGCLESAKNELVNFKHKQEFESDHDADSDTSITELEKSYLSLGEAAPELGNQEVYKKFNLDDISDLFGGENSLDKNIQQDNDSGASDKTQIYDVEEEFSRLEREQKPRVVCDEIVEIVDNNEPPPPPPSLNESNCSDNFKENDVSPVKASMQLLPRPNLANLVSVIRSNSFGISQSVLQTQNSNTTQDSPMTPVRRKRIAIIHDTTPETPVQTSRMSQAKSNIPSDDDDDSDCLTQTPIAKRKNRKNPKSRNAFLCTQVAVDGDDDDTSDEDLNATTTLGGFVVNETVCDNMDRSRMQLKYLQSLRSPNAPVNKNFLSRPLNPVNLSQIYSQMPQNEDDCEEEESEDEFASFIVNTDDEEEAEAVMSEEDELELAERAIQEMRRNKRANVSGDSGGAVQTNKKRKVMRQSDSSSEDEDMRRMRQEVM
jgi:hypothetical protein